MLCFLDCRYCDHKDLCVFLVVVANHHHEWNKPSQQRSNEKGCNDYFRDSICVKTALNVARVMPYLMLSLYRLSWFFCGKCFFLTCSNKPVSFSWVIKPDIHTKPLSNPDEKAQSNNGRKRCFYHRSFLMTPSPNFLVANPTQNVVPPPLPPFLC